MSCVAVGGADDLTVMFENQPFVGLLGRGDPRRHLVDARDFDFPTDRRVTAEFVRSRLPELASRATTTWSRDIRTGARASKPANGWLT